MAERHGGALHSRALHDAMAAHVDAGTVPGVVTALALGDELHVDAIGAMAFDDPAAGGPAPMRRDTLFRITSMTKPVVAVAAMILVEEGVLALDEPVDRLLPELAGRRVLSRPDAPLTDTVRALRPITLRDLLTFRWGFGLDLDLPPTAPIQRAAAELELAIGPPVPPTPHPPDEWMRRLGTLPLLSQPGERWLYDTGSDVLGVLISRAAGEPLEAFLQARILGPLGMVDTGFWVHADQLHRLPPCYDADPATGEKLIHDAVDGWWSRPPVFPSGSAGLVSTVDGYLAFAGMLLHGGRYGGERILAPSTVGLMTTDHLTPAQHGSMLLDDRGWGFGMAVGRGPAPTFGWDGGGGTSWFSRREGAATAILLTQHMFSAPFMAVFGDFRSLATAALGG